MARHTLVIEVPDSADAKVAAREVEDAITRVSFPIADADTGVVAARVVEYHFEDLLNDDA